MGTTGCEHQNRVRLRKAGEVVEVAVLAKGILRVAVAKPLAGRG